MQRAERMGQGAERIVQSAERMGQGAGRIEQGVWLMEIRNIVDINQRMF
ncbi:hypothetical protein ACFLZT_05040 [Thermodesulfobacteriota bacterium]